MRKKVCFLLISNPDKHLLHNSSGAINMYSKMCNETQEKNTTKKFNPIQICDREKNIL